MSRSMLAFALAFVFVGGVARGQFPYEPHAPLTNWARHHGIGYGPGYHQPSYRQPGYPHAFSQRPAYGRQGRDGTFPRFADVQRPGSYVDQRPLTAQPPRAAPRR